jgi:hypothetical protein
MYPSMTKSASAGTSRSQVTAFVSVTGCRRRKPANKNSSTVGGSGALAEYIDGGSAPRAMQTGIVSPRSAISRQCAAPTLCRCQCMARVVLPVCMMRYMPTLRMPRLGSRVITMAV